MALYNITYQTDNYYSKPVREAVLELMVLPENNPGQRCLSLDIQNSLGVTPYFTTSLYGTKVIRFNLPGRFCSFQVTVNAIVHKAVEPRLCTNHLSGNPHLLMNDTFQIDHFRYLSSNPFTAPQAEQMPGETYRETDEDTFGFMLRINQWIHRYIKYQAGITNTYTTVDEILNLRAGVCQDQTHLFIAIMRANRIPARYVSGYLNQVDAFTGAIAMHAWGEALLPGTGWIGLDPTNNCLVDDNYIKVGHGLDYTDCMPIRGIVVAKGLGSTHYKVNVIQQQ
jgi:transglutaminase-like putative cysteine protease